MTSYYVPVIGRYELSESYVYLFAWLILNAILHLGSVKHSKDLRPGI